MFRMPVQIYAKDEIFTKESLEFLKETFDENVYELVANHIEEATNIAFDVWPGHFDGRDWLKPEELYSALVNHYKNSGLSIYVYADEEKYCKEDKGIPNNYMDIYYKFNLDENDNYDNCKEEIENGEFNLIFDIDYLYAYDPDEDEEVLAYKIDDAEPDELY